jgi:hypothetical protein
MRHVTFSGLDWPVSQPRLRENKLAAAAVSEVTILDSNAVTI